MSLHDVVRKVKKKDQLLATLLLWTFLPRRGANFAKVEIGFKMQTEGICGSSQRPTTFSFNLVRRSTRMEKNEHHQPGNYLFESFLAARRLYSCPTTSSRVFFLLKVFECSAGLLSIVEHYLQFVSVRIKSLSKIVSFNPTTSDFSKYNLTFF